MPRDVSSSSSEDEADNAVAEPLVQRTEKKTTRFQCPADFVTLSHKPCSSMLMESLRNDKNELWLIKAPASFNPECFSGIKMKLSGLQTLKVPPAGKEPSSGSGQQIFSVLASHHGTSELRLLTSDKKSSDSMVFGPAFTGLVNVCESYGGSGANQHPHVIPASLAPTIPPGLKQRYQPFGSKTPRLTCEADGAAFVPSSSPLRPLVVKRRAEEPRQEEEEVEEGGKKKKKKKKDKRIKTESTEEQTSVKQEPSHQTIEDTITGIAFEEGHVSEEKKKKKKKKDREAGAEPSLEVKVEPDIVKREPIDSSYGDTVEVTEKKKKKKKKSKTDDD